MNIKMRLFTCVLAAVSAFVGRTDVVPTGGLVEAVRNAKDGDVLTLGAETYEITDELVLTNAVTIVGAGIDQTIIRQKKTDKHVAVLDNAAARIEGCNLTGANFPSELKDGVGVNINAGGGTLKSCRVTGNRTSRNWNYVVGVYCRSADGHLIDCIVDDNRVTGGTNMTEGGLYITAGTVEHCLFYNNKGHQTGGIYVSGSNVTVSDCTIAGNEGPAGTGAVCLNASGATFTNCVIAGNIKDPADASKTAPEYSIQATGAWATFDNCAFPRAITLNNSNIKGTPFQCDVLYVDPANHDYHQRIISGAKDIGYYVPFDYETFGCDFTLSTDSLFTGETVRFTAAVNGVKDGETVDFAWTVTQPDGTTVDLAGDVADFTPTQGGGHSVKLVASKEGTDPVEYVQADCFVAASREAHVATTAELLAAIAEGRDGTVITCAAGDYDLTDQVTLGKGIRLIGAGWETTTLRQTAKKHRVLEIGHANDWVEGFTITGGNSGDNKGSTEGLSGTGVYIGVNGGTVTNCHIVGNTNYNNWNHGMGIYSIGAGALITHCVITNNTRLNGVNQYGGGVYLKDGTLDNCLVAFNSVYNVGGGVYAEGAAKIRNCTVFGNMAVAGTGGGIYWKVASAQARCVNTIVAGNKTAASDATVGRPEWASDTTKATVEKTCFPSAVGLVGLSGTPLSIDPIFVDAAAGDFHMMASSATRDAGVDYAGMPETDLDGNPRKSGGTAVDLGCYEYDATQFGAAFEGPADPRGFKDVAVTYTASATGVDESLVTFNWTVTAPSGEVMTATGKTYELGAGEYGVWTVSMTATANGKTSEPYAAPYSVCPPVLYVVEPTAENMAKAEAPFDDWGKASTNLVELLRDWALPGCTIYLGEGTILVDKRVDLTADMKLIGKGWTKTTLRQVTKTTSVLYLNHEKALAKGMTITGLDATSEIHSRGAVMIEDNGGTVEDCRITGNKYADNINQACGIGITVNGEKAVCRRCVIDRNKGSNGLNNDRGGGVHGVKGLLENCLVCFNTNKYAGGISIGSYINQYANFKIRNCTVYGNVGTDADSGYGQYGVGGIGQFSGNATIENTIVYGNTSPNQSWETGGYPEWRTNGGKLTFKNCLLPEGIDWPAGAEGCLNGDPLFKDAAAGDFHLTASSPAAYKGARLDYTAESTDLDGNPRIFNFRFSKAKPDLGCYESPFGIPGLLLLVK